MTTMIITSPKKLFSNGTGYEIESKKELPYLGYVTLAYNREEANIAISSTNLTVTGGIYVDRSNFHKVVPAATANLLTDKWTHFYERIQEYVWPDDSQEDYFQWYIDSIIYCLFNTKSYQFSFKNEKFNILNQWFFIKKEEMVDLSSSINFTELVQNSYQDNNERFLLNHHNIHNLRLSSDAEEVLTTAASLIKMSIEARKIVHQKTPHWNLDRWDAGWWQIKNFVLEKYFKNDLDKFAILYKTFEDRMREGVYKFGFLK